MNGAANDKIIKKTDSQEDIMPDGVAKDSSLDTEEASSKTRAAQPHLVVVEANSANAEHMGPRLRAAREAKGWTLEAAAKETRIQKDYLRAIEDMMPNLLPGMPKYQSYLRGYLNTYTQALGLKDKQEVVQRYLNETGLLAMGPSEEEVALKDNESNADKPWLIPVIGAAAAALVIGVAVGALFISNLENSDPKQITNAGLKSAVATGKVEEATLDGKPFSTSQLTLVALDRAWVEVRGADGTVYLSKEMAPGQSYLPRIGAGWTVTVRDGGSFEWRLNGESLGYLSEPGTPVYANSVDEVLNRSTQSDNPLLR